MTRRQRKCHFKSALQAHAAAGYVRRQQPGPRERRAEGAEPSRYSALLPDPSGRRRNEKDEIRLKQGGGAGSYSGRSADRA